MPLLKEPRRGSSPTVREGVSEPGADRGPRAGSPRGMVDATGSWTQLELCSRSLSLLILQASERVVTYFAAEIRRTPWSQYRER